jgi:uncharacterized protein (TIGR00269 family)
MKCRRCKDTAVVALPSHHAGFCKDCFLLFFTRQVERAVRRHAMFTREDRILVALSGGKDSLGLMAELAAQGYDVTGLHVDLAIPESSEKARAAVEAFCADRGLPLRVVELAPMGLAIPRVKQAVRRPICSVCGKLKRYFFNKVALDEGFTVLATGHNLDDEAARLFANTLRWDTAYLSDQGPALPAERGFARKVKPLFRLGEFETANYCFLTGIDYHVGVCPYSQGASFTGHKALLDGLEETSPGQKLAFYESFLRQGRQAFQALEQEQGEPVAPCARCGYPTSGEVCGVCRIKDQVDA